MHRNGIGGVTEIPATPFKFIWFALRPWRKWFYWAALFVLIANLAGGLQSYSFKGFVDAVNLYSKTQNAHAVIFFWIISIPVLMLIAALSYRAWGFLNNYFTVYARTGASKMLFEYLSLHSLSYFNNKFSGSLSSRVLTVSQGVSTLSAQFLSNILGFLFTLVISSLLIYSVNKTLCLIVLIGFVILIPINYFMTRKQIVLSEKMVETRATMQGQIIDSITNIAAVQQYAGRAHEMTRLDKVINDHRDADVASDNYGERVLLINNILVLAFVVLIIVWAFNVWVAGAMTIGSLILVVTVSRGFIFSLSTIGENLNRIMEVYGEVREGLREIIVPHDITDTKGAKEIQINKGETIFEGVTFAYDKDPRHVFKNLSFNIQGGEKIGIVGTSGAGKTTLMKLLLRQHDILSGQILIDNQDIKDVTQDSLRRNISVVPQEPMLFHRTIRENIMYGNPYATTDEMIEVAKKAQAHDFIEMLPQRYDSLVGERGVKLSVGQRQRIAIARAFLKNAPILILDEATSALDSESEVAVQKALEALMENKTVFAIAHRLSTLRDMDRILVFKDGMIVEDGTHQSLIKRKDGVYASFWAHQAGGFIKD